MIAIGGGQQEKQGKTLETVVEVQGRVGGGLKAVSDSEGQGKGIDQEMNRE